MELTASTPRQAIREQFGVGDDELLRESEKRRRYLQTYARLLTTVQPTVRFSETVQTAVTDYEDGPEITLTTRAFEQPATELRRPVFDLAIQEALVIHEIGHLRYTDVGGFHDLLENVDPDYRRVFARVWNTFEDGAVERQLRHRYAVATELDVLNANVLRTESRDRTRRLGLFDAVLCAITDTAIYDSGRLRRLRDGDDETLRMVSLWDQRTFERVLPTLRETVRAVLTEPDSGARNDRIWSFWRALRATVDERTPPSDEGELADLIDAEGVVRVGSRPQETEPQVAGGRQRRAASGVVDDPADNSRAVPGKPDDTAAEFGRDTRSASDLDRATVARSVTRQVEAVVGGRDDNGDTETVGDDATAGTETADDDTTAVGDDSVPGRRDHTDPEGTDDTGTTAERRADTESSDGGTQVPYPGIGRPGRSGSADGTGHEDDGGAEHENSEGADASTDDREPRSVEQWTTAVEEAYAEELAAEATELDGAAARLAALDEYVHALDTASLDIPVRVATADGTDEQRQIQSNAARLARRLRRRLQQRRRDTEHTRRHRGSFDRSRLVAAVRGQSNVFTRTEEGEDRQYTCAVVLDRSASMDGGAVTAAERGALTLATALESVGVSVAILDVYESTVRLVKTVAESTDAAHARVATGQTGGGTPLASALSVVRARFDEAVNPFAIVVTDGRPDDTSAYTTTLDAVTFPVLGVYLTAESDPARPVETDRPYFHQLAVVEEWDSLDRRLRQLTEQVLF